MKKITWGVLGTAGIAKGCTIPGMQQAENCRMYAIAGRSLEKAQRFQQEFGFEKAYGSYEELLSDPNVEAVYIPLPNELHYEWTIKALKAKKHVLCEKPLAPTVDQIEAMIATAKENGVFLMEAFAYLHSPFMAAIKEEITSGAIGQVLYVDSCFITSTHTLSNIRMRRETYGGSTYDLGCYNTSQILWLLDEDPDQVQAVAQFSDEKIDLLTSGMLSFPSGARATFQCGMVLALGKGTRIDRLEVHGTEGYIKSSVQFNQEGDLCYTLYKNGVEEVKTVSVRSNYALEVEQLGRCITEGQQPHVSNAFTIRNAKVLDAVLKQAGY